MDPEWLTKALADGTATARGANLAALPGGVGVRPDAAPAMSEDTFQTLLIGQAHREGFAVAHFRRAMTRDGHWVTPVAADGKGFFDLVLIRERVIFVELKSETGTRSPEQVAWAERAERAGQEYYLWRPSNWNEILSTLAHVGRPESYGKSGGTRPPGRKRRRS